jgi:excisionase family DNA binding protein
MHDAHMPAAFPKMASRPDAVLPSRELSNVLTVSEVARELRCSKAHVHNLINGKVHDARPLPSLRLGRRRLVRRASLDEWIKTNEQCYDPIIAKH